MHAINTDATMGMSQRLLFGLCVLLIAFPWLWALDLGPLPGMLVDLVAWSTAAVLLCCLPLLRSRRADAVAWAWMLAALLNVLIALLQYFDLEDAYYLWIAVTKPGIAYGNVQQANIFASLLSAGLLSMLWLLKTNRLKARYGVFFGFIFMLGQAIAASRTGILQMVIITAMLAYWRPWPVKKMWPWVFAAALTLVVAGWALPYALFNTLGVDPQRYLLQRFSSGDGCFSRLILWSNVWELIMLKPWTGWGWDGLLYAHYIHPFEGPRVCLKLSNAHNFYLQWAVEYGLPLAFLALLGTIWLIWRFKPWSVKDDTQRLGWAVLAILGFHSMLEFPLWYGTGQVMAALALVLAIGPQLRDAPDTLQPLVRRLRVLVSTMALALLAFIAYDYHRISQIYLPDEWRAERYKRDTLAHAQRTVLFKSHALIAQVVSMPIDASNAQLMLQAAEQSLHIAPDSRIIRRLIEAAVVLNRKDLVDLHMARYRVAWPQEYAEWFAQNVQPQTPPVTKPK